MNETRLKIVSTSLTVLAITALTPLLILVFAVAWTAWPYRTTSRPLCGTAPRGAFSSDEMHWLDRASGAAHSSYQACLVPFEQTGLDGQLYTAVVELPDVTMEQVANRTSWKPAADDCLLARQYILQAFRTGKTGPWTALTWNGAPAVCKSSQHQPPDEVLVHSQSAYDLFIADTNGNDLSAYLH